jgi:DNA polymerase-1
MDWRFRKELEVQYGRDQVIKAYRDYRNGLNNCLNFQLQSLAAAVVNRAALAINRKAEELGIDAKVQAQVHDQLIINIREDQAEEFAPYVKELMETTTVLPGVTLKAPPEIANNWKDGH